MDLLTPILSIPGIGPTYQKRLKKLRIKTIRDLLYHFPQKYEDFSNIKKIKDLKAGDTFCITGKILGIEANKAWRQRWSVINSVIQDDTAAIKVTWFNQPWVIDKLKPGDFACMVGKVSRSRTTKTKNSELYISNPIFEKEDKESGFTNVGRITPVYPETKGITSKWLKYYIKPLLLKSKNSLLDPLPEKVIKEKKFLPIEKALWQIHFPDSMEFAQKARERFIFEELFNISIFVLREKLKLQSSAAFEIATRIDSVKKFVENLPFKLTDSQKKAAWQILKDLEKPRPMNRILEGDVGSGKTVVATIAMLNIFKAGYQSAFMAPTEILAKQHFQEVAKLLHGFRINIGLLTGKEDKFKSWKLKNEIIEISRSKLLERIKKDEIDLLIGTHALIQDKVQFGNLALVILDEQHRFGVEQRAKLCRNKEKIPHLLSMSATPIPRTLALTLYGDLDFSLIDQLPKGRKKIKTEVVAPSQRAKAYKFIEKEIKKGRQAFVICPRIEKKEKDEKTKDKFNATTEVKAVKEEYSKLANEIFPNLKISMLHGKMKPKEKETIMRDFKNKKADILVSTSVIEVGIDVPNATVIIIEGAERFGLAQLHQFRGRVGRGEFQSHCFLFTDSPAKTTQLRLKALIESEDGFKLAEKDLEIRGPGSIEGKRQSGLPDLTMASLKDINLVKRAREAAKEILIEDFNLKNYPALRQNIDSFRERIHLE